MLHNLRSHDVKIMIAEIFILFCINNSDLKKDGICDETPVICNTDLQIPSRRWWRWLWTALWRFLSGSCGSPEVKGQKREECSDWVSNPGWIQELESEVKQLTRSAETAVVMREYGPLTSPPHTSSIPGNRQVSHSWCFFDNVCRTSVWIKLCGQHSL